MKYLISVLYILLLVPLYILVNAKDLSALLARYKNDIVILHLTTGREKLYWLGVIVAEDKILTTYCHPECVNNGYVYFEKSKIKIKDVITLHKGSKTPQLAIVHLEQKLVFNKGQTNLFLPKGPYRPGEKCVSIATAVYKAPVFEDIDPPYRIEAFEVEILGSCCGSGVFCCKPYNATGEGVCHSVIICNDELTGFAFNVRCNQKKIEATNLFIHMSWFQLNIGTTFREEKKKELHYKGGTAAPFDKPKQEDSLYDKDTMHSFDKINPHDLIFVPDMINSFEKQKPVDSLDDADTMHSFDKKNLDSDIFIPDMTNSFDKQKPLDSLDDEETMVSVKDQKMIDSLHDKKIPHANQTQDNHYTNKS